MNQDNLIRLQIQLGFSDILHAKRLYRTVHSDVMTLGGGSLLAIGSVALLTLIPFAVVYLANKAPLASILDSLTTSIGLILLGLVFWLDLLGIGQLWFGYKQNIQLITNPREVTFDQSEVLYQRQGMNIQFTWEFFKEAIEGRKEFLLVYDSGQYIIIPKESLKGETTIDSFREMLKGKLKNFNQKLKIPFDFQR